MRSLERKYRQVLVDEENPECKYYKECFDALARHAHDCTKQQMNNFTESIENYLRKFADECPPVCSGYRTFYKYQPESPPGFGTISILFSVEEDNEGEYILLWHFRED